MSLPQWTSEIEKRTVDGEDQLGVEGAAQSYQQYIIPGITTVTGHARYYSFYAWIIYRYIFNSQGKTVKGFRGPFFRRHEVALILSAYKHHENDKSFTGVTGSGTNNVKVKKYWGSKKTSQLDQDYFVNKEGGFGQYYRTAMKNMGIIGFQEDSRLVYYLTERGKALAEAYQTSIENTQYIHKLTTAGQLTEISEEDAIDYGKVGCICPEAIKLGKDRDLLIDTLFRFQDDDKTHVRRRNSLGVALDLVDKAGGKFRRDMLIPALYLGEYSPGFFYEPAKELMDWVKRWQLVEVRHFYTLGFQCLWAAFLLELRNKRNIKLDEWWKWVDTRLDHEEWNTTIKKLAAKICESGDIQSEIKLLTVLVKEKFGLATEKDEYSRYLKAIRNQTNSSLLFSTGVRILILLYLRYYPDYLSQDPIWTEMANRERLPINHFFEKMGKELTNENRLTSEWLAWIYKEYVFDQHEIMALEKMRYQDYDTFKFYYEENYFHWPIGKKDYQEPIRLAGNRLDNCLTILADLSIIIESDDGTMALSPDGKMIHRQVIEGLMS